MGTVDSESLACSRRTQAPICGMAQRRAFDVTRHWCPPVDVRRMDQEYIVLADLPGLNLSSIDVKTTGTTLSIAGERAFDAGVGVQEYERLERLHGRFACEVNLPDALEAPRPMLRYESGVLEVRIPRR